MRETEVKHGSLPRRAGAVVLAVFAHLIVLLLMGWRIPRVAAPSTSEDHNLSMEAILVRPQVRPRARPRTQAPGSGPTAPRPPARVLITPTPGSPTLSAPVRSPPAPSHAEASADGQTLRNALRGLVGCADPGASRLSREERAACDQRLAAAKPAPVAPQFSAEELTQFDADKQDSILVRPPHNGCLPRLGDRPQPTTGPPPPTHSGAATTAGIGCAWSF